MEEKIINMNQFLGAAQGDQEHMCIMLGGISMKTAYKLLGNGEIHHLKIGKSFKIPKICVIEYLLG